MKVKEFIIGLTSLYIEENGWIIKYMDLDITCGQIRGSIMGIGTVMIWMDMEFMYGMMEGDTKGSL